MTRLPSPSYQSVRAGTNPEAAAQVTNVRRPTVDPHALPGTRRRAQFLRTGAWPRRRHG